MKSQHLGPRAKRFLQYLFSTILTTGRHPAKWKRVTNIPMHKPGKDPKRAVSYRPVSITSVVARIYERVVAYRLRRHLKFSKRQHAYARNRGCHTAHAALLGSLTKSLTRIRNCQGKSQPHTTAAISFDFTNAFGQMRRDMLLEDLRKQNVPEGLIALVLDFLYDRQFVVAVLKDGKMVHSQPAQSAGCPQGTVLGPLLWSVYIDSLLQRLDNDIENATKRLRESKRGVGSGKQPDLDQAGTIDHVCFADDLTIWAGTFPDNSRANKPPGVTELSVVQLLQPMAEIVKQWSTERGVPISDKTRLILFRPAKKAREELFAATAAAMAAAFPEWPMVDEASFVKLLGLRIDPRLNMRHQTAYLVQELSDVIKRLRRLDYLPPAWLRELWLGAGCSKVMYSAPHWWELSDESARETLETLHRAAARVITGASRSARNWAVLAEAGLQSLDEMVHREAMVQIHKFWNLRDDGLHCWNEKVPIPRDRQIHPNIQSMVAEMSHPGCTRSGSTIEWFRPPDDLYHQFSEDLLLHQSDLVHCDRIHAHSHPMESGVTKKDSEAVRLRCNDARVSEFVKVYGCKTLVFSDGSAIDADSTGPRRCAAAVIAYTARIDDEGEVVLEECFRDAVCCPDICCSYSTEWVAFHVITEALLNNDVLRPIVRATGGNVGCLTDSKSFVDELGKNVCAQSSTQGIAIWRHFTDIVIDFDIDVHIGFLFAHVGHVQNDEVDEYAGDTADRMAARMFPYKWYKDAARWATLGYANAKQSETIAADLRYSRTVPPTKGFRARHHDYKVARLKRIPGLAPARHRFLLQMRVGISGVLGGHLAGRPPEDCLACGIPAVLARDGKAVEHAFTCPLPSLSEARALVGKKHKLPEKKFPKPKPADPTEPPPDTTVVVKDLWRRPMAAMEYITYYTDAVQAVKERSE